MHYAQKLEWKLGQLDNEKIMENTYGELKVDGLITNLSVDHCRLQERAEEEKLLNLPGRGVKKKRKEKKKRDKPVWVDVGKHGLTVLSEKLTNLDSNRRLYSTTFDWMT